LVAVLIASPMLFQALLPGVKLRVVEADSVRAAAGDQSR
jgi:hypothetical protein